ncbi:Translation protein SH3-like family protein [Perilla frutescens var. hirtella]|nr:Translation protein SH3-like family protein [Perilla frutescens var. hirtella]
MEVSSISYPVVFSLTGIFFVIGFSLLFSALALNWLFRRSMLDRKAKGRAAADKDKGTKFTAEDIMQTID